MSDDVQFDEDSVGLSRRPAYHASGSFSPIAPIVSQRKGITGLLVRLGFTKDDSGAKVLMIAIVSINFIATALIFYLFVFH